MMNYFSKVDQFTMSEMQIEICISFHHDCVNIIPPPFAISTAGLVLG